MQHPVPNKCKYLNNGYCDKRIEVSGQHLWINPCVLRDYRIKDCPDFSSKTKLSK